MKGGQQARGPMGHGHHPLPLSVYYIIKLYYSDLKLILICVSFKNYDNNIMQLFLVKSKNLMHLAVITVITKF